MKVRTDSAVVAARLVGILLCAAVFIGCPPGAGNPGPAGSGTEITPFDTWIAESIATGVTKWLFFEATAGEIYNINWDDAFEGSGSYTAVLRVSAYRADMTTPYFESAPTGYLIPRQITAAATERVYVKVVTDGDFPGTFGVRVEAGATPAAFYYIETFPNGSGGAADTVMYVYNNGLSVEGNHIPHQGNLKSHPPRSGLLNS